MNGIFGATRLRVIALVVTLGVGTIVLIALGELLAAGLVVLVGALLAEIERRNTQTLALAQRITAHQSLEKLEVPQGAWGELCRAINRLVQDQRLNERLRAAAPTTLPDDGVRVLIDGRLPSSGETRTVAVLLVSCVGATRRADGRSRRASLGAWRALAKNAHGLARQHGALLQPCGDAIMLVFGAFTEHPVNTTLRMALTAAQALRAAAGEELALAGAPLAISITSGPALVTTLPGLGCCVLGAPVEQAVQIERLALASPFYPMLCGESAYYALRRADSVAWKPTEFRIQTNDSGPQIVYGMHAVTSSAALTLPAPQPTVPLHQ